MHPLFDSNTTSNTLSPKSTISIGVPQGSVLGTLLFLIYVNDINRHVHLGACNLYADDTLVYCSGSTMSELKHNIQQCVSDIHEWYDQNKFVIDKSKSIVMLATTRQQILHIDDNNLDVHIGDYLWTYLTKGHARVRALAVRKFSTRNHRTLSQRQL